MANNDPAAYYYPSTMLAPSGTIKTDRRSIAADEFFQGIFTIALEQGKITASVGLPILEKLAYEKFRNPASHYVVVSVFVVKFASGVRLGVAGASQIGGIPTYRDASPIIGEFFAERDQPDHYTA